MSETMVKKATITKKDSPIFAKMNIFRKLAGKKDTETDIATNLYCDAQSGTINYSNSHVIVSHDSPISLSEDQILYRITASKLVSSNCPYPTALFKNLLNESGTTESHLINPQRWIDAFKRSEILKESANKAIISKIIVSNEGIRIESSRTDDTWGTMRHTEKVEEGPKKTALVFQLRGDYVRHILEILVKAFVGKKIEISFSESIMYFLIDGETRALIIQSRE